MRCVLPCAALLGVLLLASTADAGRTTGIRVPSQHDPGARIDITVPYLTNGTSMQLGNGVAPAIVGKPGVGNTNNAQVKPVFNLIYYGAKIGPNNTFGGATPRPANKLRPNGR